MNARLLLTALIALAIPACTSTPAPASLSPSSSSLATVEPSAKAVTAQTGPAIGPVPPATESQFHPVEEGGLVTLQHRSLVRANEAATVHVEPDGSWISYGVTPTLSGKLDGKQLASLHKLLEEAATAKPSTGDGLPCDAVPDHATRVLFGKGREIEWSGPCAGPPPPPPVAVLAGYLNQLAGGQPASELEKPLARPR